MLPRWLITAALLGSDVAAQYATDAVPTGVPVPGNYTGSLRPQVHYSPPQGFMNDPNGMFLDAEGVWHLYYQYNPTGIVAGNQHWGHATSHDLYRWINQPIALFPYNASSFIFSGSCVVDVNNTSGFFPNQDNGVVAFYTLATYEPVQLQTQAIAYSYDSGYTFQNYDGNPIIDIGSSQFRDPKVIRYGDHWVMVLAYATEFVIGIYTSTDLIHWDHASNFTHHGLLGLQYECPNLVEIPAEMEDGSTEMMWILQISINPGAPLGGSIAEYFPGYFDGYTFTPVDGAARIADFGKDNYAGQFFYGTPQGQGPVSIAWASNWQYTQVVPTGNEGWRSVMSLPRRNSLRKIERIGWTLVSQPYDLSSIMGQQLATQTFTNGSAAVDYSSVASNAVYFQVNVTNLPTVNLTGTLNFTFMSPVSGEYIQGGFDFSGDTPFFINRGPTRGFDNPYFTDKFSTNNLLGTEWSLAGVVDRSILEVFLDGGDRSATNTYFPTQPLTLMLVNAGGFPPHNETSGDVQVSLQVWALQSGWAQWENEQGTVVGNVTNSGSSSTRTRRHPRQLYEAKF